MFAFPLSELARIAELVALYGADLPSCPKRSDSPSIRCICGGLDREESNDLRAVSYPETAVTLPLTDGRHAFHGYWSLALLAALASGEVTGEEITLEQFESLRTTQEF